MAMISTCRGLMVAALVSYGEEKAAGWARKASVEELQRTLTVAEWILHFGPHPKSGASMLIDNAVALAGVYVHEGSPRDLSRKRRDLRAWKQARDDDSGVMGQAVKGADNYDAVGSDARSFWSRE
ncbi:hypothetical protein GCM10010052_28860 [Paenarthrobacter histidinolovorans]|nr:hypothetical protein GCM10010052_28860 [Paenarthrobacter histidinolovorans]